MTTSIRTEFLAALAELGELAPELRFGQMVANVATLALGAKVESVWDAVDDELLAAARRLLERYRQRKEQVA
jgi:hypothetical protein